MFANLLSGPVVELVDVKDSQVVFRSRKRLASGREVSVRVATGQGRTVPVKVAVHTTRPLGKGFACSASLQQPLPFNSVARAAGSDPFLRQAPRRDCRLRVLSPVLPGFRALSLDFSTGGLQVEAEGEVTVGREIPIRLEFDASELVPLDCLARVAWARPAQARWSLGLQFVHLDAQEKALLERYERFLTNSHTIPGISRRAVGRVLSYTVEGTRALVQFRTEQGPTLTMAFDRYQGLTDRGPALGREVLSLRDVDGAGFTRFQFLDARDQVILEIAAATCSSH